MSKQDVYDEFIVPMKRVFSPPPHLPLGGQDEALKEYLEALERFSARHLRLAWQRIRDRHRKSFWPPIAECVAAAAEARNSTSEDDPKDRVINGRIIDGGFQPWGGACQCDRCVNKTPSPGFYRAKPEEYERDAQLRRELKEWNCRSKD